MAPPRVEPLPRDEVNVSRLDQKVNGTPATVRPPGVRSSRPTGKQVTDVQDVTLVAATVTMGLMAGVFGLYAHTIMPGLGSDR